MNLIQLKPYRGQGVAADPKKGADMLKAASARGLPSAQVRLARCYVQGAGVEKNVPEAAKWYLLAKSGGIEDEGLEAMMGKLSKADFVKAQQAAETWREQAQLGGWAE